MTYYTIFVDSNSIGYPIKQLTKTSINHYEIYTLTTSPNYFQTTMKIYGTEKIIYQSFLDIITSQFFLYISNQSPINMDIDSFHIHK